MGGNQLDGGIGVRRPGRGTVVCAGLAVVDQQGLEIGEGLGFKRRQATHQGRPTVVSDNHDADGRGCGGEHNAFLPLENTAGHPLRQHPCTRCDHPIQG